MFDGLLSSYAKGLDLALRFPFITLLTFFATLALTIHLFIVIPKGFFPQQDTGFMIGVTEAGQDISFSAMKTLQEKVGAIVQADPDVATVGHVARRQRQALNSGRMYITLKPREEREADAFQIIGACARSWSGSRGSAPTSRRRRMCAPAAGPPGRSSNTPCRIRISPS